MSTYVFGDLQGCFDELSALLDQIGPSDDDALWFVGDLINRGPKNVATLELLSTRPHTHCVLGNHDLHFLAVAHGIRLPHRSDTIDDLLTHPEREAFVNFLIQQPLIHVDQHQQVLMVHAGIPAMWSLKDALAWSESISQQLIDPSRRMPFFKAMYGNEPRDWHQIMSREARLRLATNVLTRMRFYQPPGVIDLEEKALAGPEGFRPWFESRHPSLDDWTICFGHWAMLNGVFKPGLYGLDTGCVWGRALTAVRLEDGTIFRQAAL